MRFMNARDLVARWRPGSGDWDWPHEAVDVINANPAGFADLLADIHTNGITTPVLLGDDGRVWDGHHRVLAALLVGVPVPFEEGRGG